MSERGLGNAVSKVLQMSVSWGCVCSWSPSWALVVCIVLPSSSVRNERRKSFIVLPREVIQLIKKETFPSSSTACAYNICVWKNPGREGNAEWKLVTCWLWGLKTFRDGREVVTRSRSGWLAASFEFRGKQGWRPDGFESFDKVNPSSKPSTFTHVLKIDLPWIIALTIMASRPTQKLLAELPVLCVNVFFKKHYS